MWLALQISPRTTLSGSSTSIFDVSGDILSFTLTLVLWLSMVGGYYCENIPQTDFLSVQGLHTDEFVCTRTWLSSNDRPCKAWSSVSTHNKTGTKAVTDHKSRLKNRCIWKIKTGRCQCVPEDRKDWDGTLPCIRRWRKIKLATCYKSRRWRNVGMGSVDF